MRSRQGRTRRIKEPIAYRSNPAASETVIAPTVRSRFRQGLGLLSFSLTERPNSHRWRVSPERRMASRFFRRPVPRLRCTRITRSPIPNALVSGLTIKRFPPREKLPRSRYPIGYRSSVVTMLAAIAPTFNIVFLSFLSLFFLFFFFSRPRTIVKASTRRESGTGTRCIRKIQKRRVDCSSMGCYI